MNKGFTLIELLAVLIILSILAVIVSTSVSSVIKKSGSQLSEVQQKKIEDAANQYYVKEAIDEYYNSSKACINVRELIDKGYVDSNIIKNPENNEEMLGSVKIIYEANQYKYEYQAEICGSEDFGIICEQGTYVVSGSTNKYDEGNQFICEVSNGVKYNFHVLSHNTDETINLILDSNICEDGTLASVNKQCTTSWNLENNNQYGPVNAMQYLYNATSTWTNIPDIIIDYIDEDKSGDYGYGIIKTVDEITTIKQKDSQTTATFKNLKARLPERKEVSKYDSTAIWLYSNLHLITPDNTEVIGGYWTLSSNSIDPAMARFASDTIVHSSIYELGTNSVFGVRPVITISKKYIK